MPQAVATRYARALVEAVLDPAAKLEPKQASTELDSFREMLAGTSELRNVLISPAVSPARKRAVVARFADMMPLSRIVRNFLYVIIDRRRIHILDEIADAFNVILDERLGVVRADVRSARTLTPQQQSELQSELSQISGKQVRCNYSVDEDLLGGVVAKIGSTVYDGSVRAQLNALKQRLVAR
jgi:F-type H+-transporting ATPase subunit delta